MTTDSVYMADVTRVLQGGIITGALLADDEDSWGLKVVLPDGTVKYCWVDCDAEGNGPGWLTIEDGE